VKIHLKLPDRLLAEIAADLHRPHPVATERVGFIASVGGATSDGIVLLGRSFHPVRDDDYEPDELVGARIGSRAVQRALALAYAKPQSMLFVHEHRHKALPIPSRVDLDCWRELIPNFWHVRPALPHGAVILSEDAAMGLIWVPEHATVCPINKVTVVGRRLRQWSGDVQHD
jgi:hypothetical protein